MGLQRVKAEKNYCKVVYAKYSSTFVTHSLKKSNSQQRNCFGFLPIMDPSSVFSTFDWDQLAKIRQHGWKERLKISQEDIAP